MVKGFEESSTEALIEEFSRFKGRPPVTPRRSLTRKERHEIGVDFKVLLFINRTHSEPHLLIMYMQTIGFETKDIDYRENPPVGKSRPFSAAYTGPRQAITPRVPLLLKDRCQTGIKFLRMPPDTSR